MTVFITNIHNIQGANNNIFENCENRECNYTAERWIMLSQFWTGVSPPKNVRKIYFILNAESKSHTLFYYGLSLQASLFLNGVSRYQTNNGQGRYIV